MSFPFPSAFDPRGVGESIYSESGLLYDQVPRLTRGKLSSSRHAVLGAIIELCNETTATICRDVDIQKITGCALRTIQHALKALEESACGLIKRFRGEGRRQIVLQFRLKASRKDKERKGKKADSKQDAAEKTEAAPPAVPEAQKIDLSTGKWAVDYCRDRGWRLVAGPGGSIEREPIEAVEQVEITQNFRDGALRMYKASILAYLMTTHKRE